MDGETEAIVRAFTPEDEGDVVRLWERCGLLRPWNDPHKDIARKLTVQPELFLVATIDGIVVGSVMAGYEGHRGWVNYLAVAPDHQGRGLGRLLMGEVERGLLSLGCPKVNLQIRSENTEAIQFYTAIGFTPDRVLSMGKRIISDDVNDPLPKTRPELQP